MLSVQQEAPTNTFAKSGITDVIRARRSTKSFVPNQLIPQEILEEILYSGSLAPSGFNLQPWRFIIIETPEGKEKLYSCAFEQEQIKQASVILICCGERQVFLPEYIEDVFKLGLDRGSMNEKHAQFLRQTIPTFHKFHPSFESIEAWMNRQVMIAVTQMMLVAKSLNIDSCPMEGFVSSGIKEAFTIPKSWDICCLLALGYAEQNREFGGRFPLEKICFKETFNEVFTPKKDDNVEKLREDIDTLETQIKKVVDLQNSLLEGSSNLELKAKQIELLAHCTAREISYFRELAIRLNSTYQILLQQLPKVKISWTLETYALKQLSLEDITLIVPTLIQKDFSFILSLLEVIQKKENTQLTSTNHLQNKLETETIVPLSNFQPLPKLPLKVKEFDESDLMVQQLISE